ncbi:flagellar hook-basal body complex protein [Rhodospirillum sp. A1_3_36]|uniref:flagellar hook-basal body complex protein n=1 Tax=Rhodospirillum sp. A1_3_36 TaxID=3391666 RepID=UPI0039A4869B
MSLYGALFSGVSGLQAQSSAMGAIADNVTNVNTVGYKGTKVNFKTLVTQQTSLTQYSPGGVQSAPRTGVDVQGLLQATTSATDVGISGSGFFVVSGQAENPEGYAYTRAGSFKIDKDGYLQNTAGYYMQGWPLDNWDGTASASTVDINGNTYQKSYKNVSGDTYYINPNAVDATNMQALNLNTIGGTARATSTLTMGANLPKDAAIGATSKTNALIFDSLGSSHNLVYTWVKRDQNAWDVEVTPPEGSTYATIDDQTTNHRTYFSAGRLDFTAIPKNGTSFTMDIGGTNYTFGFNAGGGNQNQLDDGVSNNTSTVQATYAPNDTITIDGATFTLVNGTPADETQVDISAITAGDTAAVANAVADTAEAYFDKVRGPGTYVTAAAGVLTSSLPITAGSATSFTNSRVATTTNTFAIDTTGKSLSQVLDQLGLQVNTAMAMAFKDLPVTNSSPASWGGRVAGENGIVFRNADTTNSIAVDASSLTDSSNNAAVLQTVAYDVPALDSAVRWTNTAASKNYAMTFSGDGKPTKFFGSDETAASDPRSQIRLGWATGALNMDGSAAPPGSAAISQFWGNYNSKDGFTQLAGKYQLNYISQNGNKFGNFAGLSIGEDGVVTALFDNGVTTPIFMIPIATFVNPNGMESLTGNVFQETTNSGLPTVREAGEAGSGTVNQATLEASTVDLGTEFTNMITTQRAYSASAKIITTADDMLTELLSIKR